MRPVPSRRQLPGGDISIHASRMGCDHTANSHSKPPKFQSTHPVWDATAATKPPARHKPFQSTHPVWDATINGEPVPASVEFQSTHPVWDATRYPLSCSHWLRHFNPRIPYGMRLFNYAVNMSNIKFQSTHPVWDATFGWYTSLGMTEFQSTHPVWDATSPRRRARGRCWHFNPRIPYGMRPLLVSGVDTVTSFQSTHPVWDATWARPWTRCPRSISIHASRMGCDVLVLLLGDALPISIHASRMGCDTLRGRQYVHSTNFNPRIPYGMRPNNASDSESSSDFNPRIPYGMRQLGMVDGRRQRLFQSTHPVWDATFFNKGHVSYAKNFNPRIPYGMRPGRDGRGRFDRDFNPRIPYGMRPNCSRKPNHGRSISIHASRMGCDARPARRQGPEPAISIHASRMGCDLAEDRRQLDQSISIHASRMGCDYSLLDYRVITQDFNPRIPYGMRLREWTLHSIIWKLLPALRADYIADIPEHLSVCIFGL